ncbi:Ribonucleoside-diphosphate reductase [Sulfidibacter corallicola]|uniref:Ribonucleoside-diphosphate reductase n=1 Tax=Sulfidibacter corallicola TaxID=2818388 RepID=A0A8A4TLU1_SULCO|nr:ribonucleoside-diphosphate reductase subunit alpha [Sulfidibacter corallicola]QTD49838.1 ribonucleoside-diphosphate reductase subunit alpha [Sulfidibacter corallicola]
MNPTVQISENQQQPNPRTTDFEVIRRDGGLTAWDPAKIERALAKAFLAVHGDAAAENERMHRRVPELAAQVAAAVTRHKAAGAKIHVEEIQDQVELVLMRAEEYKVARAYVLYREARAEERARVDGAADAETGLWLQDELGRRLPMNPAEWRALVRGACAGIEDVDAEAVLKEGLATLYDGATTAEVYQALVFAARAEIERQPRYNLVAARLLRMRLIREVRLFGVSQTARRNAVLDRPFDYGQALVAFVTRGIEVDLLDPRLAQFDLARLGEALVADRDDLFTYLGLQTLYDRYFLQHEDLRGEMPQIFFMRVAMGLALEEVDREAKAIEFYHLLSTFRFMCSTPTLFNSGTRYPQLSSCFLTTIGDDLGRIYDGIRDNALLSKFAGGIGNDWTPVRGMGAHIKGTNGKSLGVVPFLKVANDTAVAVNQGGKRKGAVCAYLEVWHVDIEDFLELRKNTGDDRRRTHDMNTAVWVPDLFLKRLSEEGDWTLFSPDEVPDLHESFGRDFEERYRAAEARADRGEIRVFRRMPAWRLWRKMLTMLFETGHPWITFKDACNARSPQQHVGVIHNSNLCTEITLNTSADEIAVCNLGSVNLVDHLRDGTIDHDRLRETVHTAMRMLDNVIDINHYTVAAARNANLRHRPVGLGIMGFQDALYRLGLPYDSEGAVTFADQSMEAVSYYAFEASAMLAAERGRYPSYEGSLWSRGILPIDSLALLEQERGGFLEVDRTMHLDWAPIRALIERHGMRHSNCLAIAPTATISNICGVSQSIEPTYRHLFVKANMSGDFTVVNPHLVAELAALGLWDETMVADLKYHEGCLEPIERIPQELKRRFATAFEIEVRWLIEAGARRQKWLDQSQSLNLYLDRPSGRMLDEMYRLAWRRGLKTTYYLRSMGATHAEKATVEQATLNAVEVCSIDDPDCDACQ